MTLFLNDMSSMMACDLVKHGKWDDNSIIASRKILKTFYLVIEKNSF